jgi:hypothetical protein
VTQNFDQFSNAYGNMQSVVGSGGSTVDFMTTSSNAGYFPTPIQVIGMHFVTSNAVPFTALDPSRLFPGLGAGNTDITPALGAVNGVNGPDFQFSADAFVTAVPEPTSLCLTGLGLGGILVYLRRRRAQVA